MYGVARKSADILRMSLVTSAAMLAICLLASVETSNASEVFPPRHKGKIAFSTYSGGIPNIYAMNADGTNQKRIADISVGGALVEPAWSPDGKKIAFVISRRNNEMNIVVLGADGTLRELQSRFSQSVNPAWSPDGTKLAVSVAQPNSIRDIYIMDSDGSNPINLTRTPEHDEMFPAFSPDGSQICFSRDSGLYVMNADGSDPTPLADEHLLSQGCDWSPDGTKIAFTYIVGGTEEVYVINADGSGQTNLTRTNNESERDPDWSPDGTRIAFERGTNEDVDIYTMNADGSDVAQLTHTSAHDMDPDWRPLAGPTKATPEKQQEHRQQDQQQQRKQGSKSSSVTPHLKDTGGPSLLWVASALLFSGGSLLYAVARRNM